MVIIRNIRRRKTFVKSLFIIPLLFLLLIPLLLINRNSNKSKNIPTYNATATDKRLVKKITTLVKGNGRRVDWSQQNNLIVFGKGTDSGSHIYTMKEDGSDQICITCNKPEFEGTSNDQPEWYPGGEYILFQSTDKSLTGLPDAITQGGAGLNNNFWIISKDGSRYFKITNIKNKEANLHPHFSQDGKQLFWGARRLDSNSRNGRWQLKLANFDISSGVPSLSNEQTFRPLSEDKAFYESHGFSKDNNELIFSASKEEIAFDLDIYTYNLTTKELTNLTNTPGVWDEHAIISPSGKKLIWASSQNYDFVPSRSWGRTLKLDYWVMNIDGSNKEKITFFNEKGSPEYKGARVIVADSAWNRDGNKVVALAGNPDSGRVRNSDIILIEFNENQ